MSENNFEKEMKAGYDKIRGKWQPPFFTQKEFYECGFLDGVAYSLGGWEK